jgi:Uma2 family endonuclease
MNIPLAIHPHPREIVYPESDGMPMADNTKQLDWITLLYSNLRILFRDRPQDVFVGANQLWYPVEGQPEIRKAPDVYVVFGRPQQHRGSYRQWEEGGIPITVAIEIHSPGNDYTDLIDTLLFYEGYGVEEYLLYDPESGGLQVHLRQGQANQLRPIRPQPAIYTSERLGVRFDNSGDELVVYFPDGRRFITHEALDGERREFEQRAREATLEAERQRQRADKLSGIADRLANGTATPEDLAELRKLSHRTTP